MSILNVNTIQPIGSGTTVTVAATELKTSNFITVGTGASVTSPSANVLTLGTNTAERLRITSTGYLGLGTNNPSYLIDAHTSSGNAQLRVKSGGDLSQLILESTDTSGYSQINFADAGSNNIGMLQYFHSDNHMEFTVNGAERLRITSAGVIQCGTSATLKAEINNSVSGHQFISQCSDNNNGFEVYQQHASNTTRNNFAVYANTGSGNAKNLQFAVRGDGAVTKPGQPLAVIGTTQNNLTPSTGSIIQFDYAATNRGNHYNTTNYTFTCPVAGDYMVILRHSRKGWCGDLDLQKNGTTHAFLELRETGLNGAGTPAPDWQAGSYSFIVPCAANDVLRWRVGATYTATGSGGYLLDGYNHIKYDAVTYYLIG